MKYIKNPYARELYSEKQVLLCNTKTGGYLKTNRIYYKYLEFLMKKDNGNVEWETIEDDDVKHNMQYLFSELLKIGYIINEKDYDKIKNEKYEVIYLSITNRCN